MAEPFIGSEAVATGEIVKSALRTKYTKLFRDVYVNRGTEVTAQVLARAGWLWSGRQGIIAGLSASALYGAKWIDTARPLEMIHSNRNRLAGLRIRSDRIEQDEFQLVDGIPVTTPARTVLDLACWYSTFDALAAIDALARATEVETSEVETLIRRYRARRGIRSAHRALGLMDPGAQSPKETWLRLLLIEAGFPRPQTQIPVHDEFGDVTAYLDMGWEDLKVAVEYDGDQHRSDRRQYRWDIRRLEMLERLGWIVVRVTAGDAPQDIIRRVRPPWPAGLCVMARLPRRASRQRDHGRRASRRRDTRRTLTPSSLASVMGSIRSNSSAIDVRQLGTLDYLAAWQLQRELADARVAGGPDTLLLLQHPPVYTAGRRTEAHERPLNEARGTPVVDTDRGGKITWHGPGQLVGYPIIGLAEPLDVINYVRRLEESLIAVCADLGLDTIRVEGRSGVWVPADAGRPNARWPPSGFGWRGRRRCTGLRSTAIATWGRSPASCPAASATPASRRCPPNSDARSASPRSGRRSPTRSAGPWTACLRAPPA